MRKTIGMAVLAGVLVGCGGGGVLDGQVPVYETGLLIVEPTVSSITSDVLSRRFEEKLVKTKDANGQCNATTQAQVCTGATYSDDKVVFNFSLKQTAGYIASPVGIIGYKVSYDNCVSGEVYVSLSPLIINPEQTIQKDIVVVPEEVKRRMVQQELHTYRHNDGCETIFTRPTYNTTCYANAIIEFDTVEVFTGINRKVRKVIRVKFEDTPRQNECI